MRRLAKNTIPKEGSNSNDDGSREHVVLVEQNPEVGVTNLRVPRVVQCAITASCLPCVVYDTKGHSSSSGERSRRRGR